MAGRPPGLDRAVETILGERVRGRLVEEPMAASRAVEFLKGQQLGRGAFTSQQLRWSPDASAEPSAVWWPAISGQPGVVGRATDLIHARGELRAYSGISFRRHCGCGSFRPWRWISGSGIGGPLQWVRHA